ncbi:hypothetical protein B0H14DRAFT_3080816 [Mycena olivaceomarginata]|nr:hypothetical protein B0H14DRAFT_3080816 [Mycena olivaceomarginata]
MAEEFFLGFMVMVKDPGNPMDCTDKENYEFAQFKREIHQHVLEIIFSSLYLRSWRSEVVTCGDEITRVLYPGFLIESLNFEEAWNFTCCRAGCGKFPSPRCLVSHEMLHFLQRTFEACTSSNMRAIVCLAQNAPNATQKEKILMEHGLHDVVHFMWNFRFSDPYQAVSYNLLYFNESGKWGHHLWPLIRDLLRELHLLTEMTDIMTTKDFTDGQTHSDILKVYSRIEVFQKLIGTYEYWCDTVSKDYNKNFRFPKRHFIVHAVQDIWSKGIANEDEDQEAIACTRLIVDNFFWHLSGKDVDDNEATNQQSETAQFKQQSGRRIPKSKLPPASSDNQWIFGSSKDDWMECEDILRCNNNWYKSRPRYDCVLFNTGWEIQCNQDKLGLACTRLRSLIRCKLPSRQITDIAIVQTMKRSSWCPRTVWDGCAMYDEKDSSTVVKNSNLFHLF